MVEYALINDADSTLIQFRHHHNTPVNPGGKAWTWYPVSRITGDGGSHLTDNVWVIETPEPAATVPDVVNRWDALEVLYGLDTPITEAQILAQIMLISNAEAKELARISFYRPTWARNHSLISTLASAFSLDSDDIDALFIAAAAL